MDPDPGAGVAYSTQMVGSSGAERGALQEAIRAWPWRLTLAAIGFALLGTCAPPAEQVLDQVRILGRAAGSDPQ